MSIIQRSKQYSRVFDHWRIDDLIGVGSGGKTAVFSLSRIDREQGTSALKAVNLFEEQGDWEALPESARTEYLDAVQTLSEKAGKEVQLMNKLQGNTNIVNYLDHSFRDWSYGGFYGRDLLIRMELLKDLRSQIKGGKSFDETEILKIGSDICSALILCHGKNILHRDLKPGNIFVNADGVYKLGDFGISRVLDSSPGVLAGTGIGTLAYVSPEQYRSEYDIRTDIYSLGLVLYELSNNNRLPFSESSYVSDEAVHRRLSGELIPAPINASERFSEIILKACAFDASDRYQSAKEFKECIDSLMRGRIASDGSARSTLKLHADSRLADESRAKNVELVQSQTRTESVNAFLRKILPGVMFSVTVIFVMFFATRLITGGEEREHSSAESDAVASDSTLPTMDRAEKILDLSGTGSQISFAVADELKKLMGVEYFDTIVLSEFSGVSAFVNGGYISYMERAPILSIAEEHIEEVAEYIMLNSEDGAEIVLLGGANKYAEELSSLLPERNISLLYGKDRYDTNLKVLSEYNTSDDLIVCNAEDKIACLLAASTGKPVLLAGSSFSEGQTDYLSERDWNITVVNGREKLDQNMVNELIAMDNNLEILDDSDYSALSLIISERFFEDAKKVLVIDEDDLFARLSVSSIASIERTPIVIINDRQSIDDCEYLTDKSRVIIASEH